MKRCPICQNTFDDSKRFCQLDGTLLVEEAGGDLPFDDEATKTLVSPFDRQSAQTPFDETTSGSSPFSDFSSPASGSFASDSSSSSSLFSAPEYEAPAKPFAEPPPFNSPAFEPAQNQFGQSLEQASWTPPPAPVAGWQSQNIGANTPFAPPVYGGGQGQNQTLPIISLALGVLGFVLVCCWGGVPFGLAALVTGFIGMQNVGKDPQTYGGKGLALAGMILGGISIALGVLILIFAIAGSWVR